MTDYTRFPKKLQRMEARHGREACWRWRGAINRKGYAVCGSSKRADGDMALSSLAYKRAYQILRGPVPDGFQLDHTCRNKRCVNPWHLEVVTPRENVRRRGPVLNGNARKTHCIHGHPLSGEHLGISWRGHRHCVTCKRIRDAARYALIRAQRDAAARAHKSTAA